MTWRTDGKLESASRKPLRNVTNSAINKPRLKSSKKLKLKQQEQEQEQDQDQDQDQEQEIPIQDNNNNEGDPLHRLISVHSDVTSLLQQIDEVVVEAFKVKIDKENNELIDSFTNVLAEIQSSLKPWVLRLQEALAVPCADPDIQLGENPIKSPILNEGREHEVDTPEPIMPESLVSPSPLVSWRATDFKADVGKQLFLLTPLPRSRTSVSKPLPSVKPTRFNEIASSRSTASKVPPLGVDGKSDNYKPEIGVNALESTSKLEFLSPSINVKSDLSTVLATPCFKYSPPVSCVLQEPYNHFSYRKIDQFHKSTPFPVWHKNNPELTDSESSSDEVSKNLGLKYPELIGIKPSCTKQSERRPIEESPLWIRSPPKCCTLMEPLNEKPVKHDSPSNGCMQKLTSSFNQQLSLVPPKQNNAIIHNQDNGNKNSSDNFASNLVTVESTPLWKGPESIMRTGKRPGENTLKRELWTRFEAASFANDFDLDSQETSHKGFLDRLDEAS